MDKQYKLIKEYPGEPRVGSIIKKTGWFDKWMWIQENPLKAQEFFEEAIVYTVKNEPIFNGDTYYTVHMRKDNIIIPYKVYGPFTMNNIITDLDFEDGNGYDVINTRYFKTLTDAEKWLKENKPRKPLFTTEDGVEIYEGDVYWAVGKNLILTSWSAAGKSENYIKSTKKMFSTEEAAQEYVDNNSPKFTKKDMFKAFKAGHEFVWTDDHFDKWYKENYK